MLLLCLILVDWFENLALRGVRAFSKKKKQQQRRMDFFVAARFLFLSKKILFLEKAMVSHVVLALFIGILDQPITNHSLNRARIVSLQVGNTKIISGGNA